MAQKLYKFLHSKDVGSILSGTVMFKDFRVFRDLPPPIGDALEGYARINVDRYEFNAVDGGDAMGGFAELDPGSAFQDLSIQIGLPKIYISCFSIGELNELAPRMLHNGDEQYDAAIEISDLQALAEDLYACGMVDGVHTHRYFGGLDHRRVDYGPGWQPPVTKAMTLQAIYSKHTDYRGQSEYRFTWPPLNDSLGPTVFVTCPQAASLFRRVI